MIGRSVLWALSLYPDAGEGGGCLSVPRGSLPSGRLIADAALLQRRAAGEPLRQLASDYHVAHTTLSRYFARTEVRRQLQQIRRQQHAQNRARNAARRPAQRSRHSQHAAKPDR